RKIYGFRGLVDGDIDEERVFRPNDSNQNAAVKNDAGEDNANKKGGK
ncbi:urease subunit beta, partial [Staphylococcus warneri]